jgi:hypothetical protein
MLHDEPHVQVGGQQEDAKANEIERLDQAGEDGFGGFGDHELRHRRHCREARLGFGKCRQLARCFFTVLSVRQSAGRGRR